MPFDAEDLAAFVDSDMPAYSEATVGGVTVSGLFRKAFAAAFGMVGGNDPQLIVVDTIAASENTAVSIGGVGYTVTSVEDNGTGMRTLNLQAT